MGTVHLPKKPPARLKKTSSSPELILQHLMDKLPPGSGGNLDTADILKKLSSSIDRHCREITSRLASAQDEAAVGARQTSAGVAQTLLSLGGSDTFNVGEAEKPSGRKKAGDLEAHASSLLRQKTGAAALLPAEAAVTVVKCRFRDNALKPKTVTDVKLAVNVTEPELFGPFFSGDAAAQCLIRDFISPRIIECIDKKSIDKEIDDEWIAALFSDIDSAHFDASLIRGNAARGAFSRALNALVALLDRAKLDYQCIENTRGGQELAIREYDDSDPANLPDERYALRLRYFDEEQLAQERADHDARLAGFEREVQLLWDLIEVNYQDSKPVFKVNDFEDLARKNKGRIRDLLKRKNAAPAQEIIKEPIAVRFARMHERIKNMYEFLYPVERRLMEDRLAWLEGESARLDFMINPRHLRPGLLVDVEVTSIKRRKATLGALAAVLGEFLHGVYGCFQDAGASVLGA